MKISILLPHLRPYGGILRMLQIADRARAMGHDITIYHSDTVLGQTHDHLIYVFPEQYPDAHRMRAKHLYHYNLNLYNKHLLRVPTTISFFLRRIFAVNRAYWIRRAVFDSYAKILVNCSDSVRWLRRFGVDAVPVLGAVDHERFRPLMIPKNHHTIVCLGSPKYWKGSEIIEQAVAIVQKTYPQVILKKFYGTPQDQLSRLYNQAGIVVDAQLYAGWNNPMAEAMACKVPVVCYDIGPNYDIAIHERTALLVPPKRPDLMAQAILRLLNDPTLRDAITERAYELIQTFTWEKTTRDFLSALNG